MQLARDAKLISVIVCTYEMAIALAQWKCKKKTWNGIECINTFSVYQGSTQIKRNPQFFVSHNRIWIFWFVKTCFGHFFTAVSTKHVFKTLKNLQPCNKNGQPYWYLFTWRHESAGYLFVLFFILCPRQT